MKLTYKISTLFLVLLLAAGCNKSSSIPEPPRAESDLISELFTSLKDNNYPLAAQKIKRLRMLNPADFYLANIEYQVQIDSGFYNAQEMLDSGKVSEAYTAINNAVNKYGNQENLLEAQKKLKILSDIDKSIKKINSSNTSSKVAVSTAELNRIIQENKFADVLKPFADYSLNRARKLMTNEDMMAKDDLKSDIDIARIADPDIAETMIAQLAIIDNKDSIVKSYEKTLAENWSSLTLPDSSIKLNDEILYFRQSLLKDKENRDKMFSKLLVEPPGNFCSMLIRAYILKSSGYPNEANALAQVIKSSLQLKDSQTENWFKVIPAQITDFYSLNPFVLYPFFVYCESSL